jgi:hypothetical protein
MLEPLITSLLKLRQLSQQVLYHLFQLLYQTPMTIFIMMQQLAVLSIKIDSNVKH